MNILINHLLFVYASQDLKILFRREKGKTLEAFLNLSSKVEASNLSPKPYKLFLPTGCIMAEAQGRQPGCPFHGHSSDLAAWADPWNTQFGAPSHALRGMFSTPESCLEFSCHISYCKHPFLTTALKTLWGKNATADHSIYYFPQKISCYFSLAR